MIDLRVLEKLSLKQLTHYGVLGMKWGVRKDKGYSIKVSDDGALTIKKGSNIHRTTSNPNEKHEGHAYASFTEKDVNHYNAAATSWLYEASSDYDNLKVFDMTQKVTKDLIAPSEKKKIETFVKMLDDKKFVKEIRDVHSVNDNDGDQKRRRFNDLKAKFQKGGMDANLAAFYSAFCMGLNNSPKLRNDFFSKLGAEGYNMITDTEDSYLEAHAPIIVFNRKDTLKVLKTKELPKKWSKEWLASRSDENLSDDKTWKSNLKKTY